MAVSNNPKQPITPQKYLIVALVSLIIAIACLILYLTNLSFIRQNQHDKQVYYILLILFGFAVCAFIFGAMNSYATLKGTALSVHYNFTGPIAGMILVVYGGFYLPEKFTGDNAITIRVKNGRIPLDKGNIKVYQSNTVLSQPISEGQAIFYLTRTDEDSVKVEFTCTGYQPQIRYINIQKSKIFDLSMNDPVFTIRGIVKNADEFPINNVEVNLEDTPCFTQTRTDGSYVLVLKNVHLHDQINLITSVHGYKDKTIPVEINDFDQRQDITLAPVP